MFRRRTVAAQCRGLEVFLEYRTPCRVYVNEIDEPESGIVPSGQRDSHPVFQLECKIRGPRLSSLGHGDSLEYVRERFSSREVPRRRDIMARSRATLETSNCCGLC